MLFNKEKRIKYMGFDDFWFVVIGCLILGTWTTFLFNESLFYYSFGEIILNWAISLSFSVFNWLFIRGVLIFLRKKFTRFEDSAKRAIIIFVSIVGIILLVDFVINAILKYKLGDIFNPAPLTETLIPVLILSVMIMAIYEAIYFYTRLKTSVREEEQAKQVIVQAKLDALRNQAQPHFLFNSLNTLRDIIDQDSKADAKKFVDNLADVYRFILESGSSNLISLRDELKFSKAYIHIQSERFGENLKLNWAIPEDRLNGLIVPMSLQLLLENAIKHNVISKANPLTIEVAVDNNELRISNKIKPKSTQMPSTKLGLKNIEKRYALISDKMPVIKNDGHHFVVTIPLLKPSDQKK